MTRHITKLEFFPDYFCSGVWATYDNGQYHETIELHRLEQELNIVLPKWLVNKINAAQLMYVHFEPADLNRHEEKYGLVWNSINWDTIEFIIAEDFIRLYPQFKDIVALSNGNKHEKLG